LSVSRLMTESKDRVARSVEKRGVAGTAWLAVLLLIKYLIQEPIRYGIHLIQRLIQHLITFWKRCSTRNPFNPWYQFLDRQYDRWCSVNTAGMDLLESIPDLDVNAYSPAPRSTFFLVLRQIEIDPSKFVFIDFGCGRGKPLLLASELPFKSITGIELSPDLVKTAEENLRTYRWRKRCKVIQVIHADAREYQMPNDPAICFFYDPFKADTMAQVLDNIRQSLAAAPRDLYILYILPKERHLMDQSAFLAPIKQTAGYCIYKAQACGTPSSL
jgi:SAM-dependent methyltransferase